MKFLLDWAARLPLMPLAIGAILLAGAPFVPQPHLVEKARWLIDGTPLKPIDWFDIFWHSWPVLLIALKFAAMARRTQ